MNSKVLRFSAQFTLRTLKFSNREIVYHMTVVVNV